MAYGTLYKAEFKDIQGLDWKILIQEDPDPGTVIDLTLTGDPLHFEFNADSDDFNDPIRPSKAIINILSLTNFSLAGLYSDEDFKYKVLIYKGAAGTDLYWSGFLVTGEYSEPYDQVPYPVQLVAVDGLNYLKNLLYKYQTTDPDDTYYNGRRLESQIILDILGKIQITGFTEYINMYEVAMADSVDDSPMDQLKIDVDIFRDMYCFEVLYEVLKKYNAVIRQVSGEIVIYRPEELVSDPVYGRKFTAVTTKTSVHVHPDQYINRQKEATPRTSNLVQFPGSALMVKRPAKLITLNQDYGHKESWIDNWQFKAETFNGTEFEFWTKIGGNYTKPIGDYVAGEKDGVALINHVSTDYIYQDFGVNAKISTTDLLFIEFEYATFNITAATILNVTIGIEIHQVDSLSNVDGTFCQWDATPGATLSFLVNATSGWSGWNTYKRQVLGIPNSAVIRIYLYPEIANAGDVYNCFKNIKFSTSSTQILEKKVKKKLRERLFAAAYLYGEWTSKYHTVKYRAEASDVVEHSQKLTNAINGIEKEFDYILGDVPNVSTPVSKRDVNIDNVIEQFAGSLATTLASLTKVAEAFVTDHSGDYSGGGVVVTSSGEDIIMTSDTPGVNFTGNTTITGTSGDLTGSVDPTQANVTALARIDRVTLTGTSGEAGIECNGVTRDATFNGSLTQTAADFVTNMAGFYAPDVIVTSNLEVIIFTANTPGVDFAGDTTITNSTPNLSGSVNNFQANRVAVARVDTITLTGTYGTADILCDGVTEEATFKLTSTTVWNTRTPGGEADPLLEITGGEIGNQYSRPKQLIQMNIRETGADLSLNILGNIQDEMNKYSAVNRKFVVQSCDLGVKSRVWNTDLIEII